MKTVLISIILSSVALTSCDSSNTSNTNAKPLVVASDTATVKYQCPMKCQGDTTYTMAGQCPVCEMDLEKVTK